MNFLQKFTLMSPIVVTVAFTSKLRHIFTVCCINKTTCLSNSYTSHTILWGNYLNLTQVFKFKYFLNNWQSSERKLQTKKNKPRRDSNRGPSASVNSVTLTAALSMQALTSSRTLYLRKKVKLNSRSE